MNVVNRLARLRQLELIIAAELDACDVMLFKTDINPTPDTPLASLVECDFTGYAQVAIVTWSAAFLDPQGIATATGGLIQFASSGDTVQNTAYGMAVLNGDGDLVYAERFETPFSFFEAGNTLQIVPKFQLGAMAAI